KEETADVGEGSNEDRGGNRGIYLEPLQQNRNERAREAGDEEIAGHREEHNEPQLSTPSHRDGYDRYRNPDRKPIDQPDENLLSHYPKKAVRRNEAQGQASHRHRESLSPGVAAHSGDDGHPHRERHGPSHSVLEQVDHGAGHEGCEQVDEEPGQSAPHRGGPPGPQFLVGRDATEAEEVLGLLFFHHVNDVVEGDLTQQASCRIHYRDARHVVALDKPGDFLLVLLRCHPHVGIFHELTDRPVRGTHDQPLKWQYSYQLAIRVYHEDVREIFDLLRLFSQGIDRFRRRTVVPHRDHMRGHDAAGGLG